MLFYLQKKSGKIFLMLEANEKITIRPATIADGEKLLEIYSYYVKNTAISFEWEIPSLKDFQNRISTTLEKYPYLVAQNQAGEILGYCYAGPFKNRAAYNWAVETSIYIDKNKRQKGLGRLLYTTLENTLKEMNIVNMKACITFPQIEDQYLTKNSFYFHQKMGFTLVGQFTKCGYKFNRWYNMIWMEKIIGTHQENMPAVIPYRNILKNPL